MYLETNAMKNVEIKKSSSWNRLISQCEKVMSMLFERDLMHTHFAVEKNNTKNA